MAASDLERGKFFLYKGEVLQVIKRGIVNVGTHSHTKLVFTCRDIYGKREKVITMGHNDRVEALDLQKKKASVISKSENNLQIMDAVSYETLDAEADRDIMDSLEEGDEVVYIEYKGIKVIGMKKK
ncbi:hypothetical protein JXC34_06185 [Candidatus Woesearchaeota archaeon]|nr:hypothetical protein [Candidatus Woesearchaeota archaeon]